MATAYNPQPIIDLVLSYTGQTVKQLRDRARELRDRHNLKARFKGLWKLRKNELVRLLVEVETALLNPPTTTGEQTMLYKSIETQTAAAVIRGAARGAKALGANDVSEYAEEVERIQSDVEDGKEAFDQSDVKGLEQKPEESGGDTEKKTGRPRKKAS